MGIVLDLSYICILPFVFSVSDHNRDGELFRLWLWPQIPMKEGKCKHENPISQLNLSNYQSERWKVTEWNFSGHRMLSGEAAALCPRWPHCPPGRSGGGIWWWTEIIEILRFNSRSLPLPKLGLNNSCWNAGRSWDVDVCVGNLLLNFSLVWTSDKNVDKKWFHVSLSNSCLGGVNDYTSDVNISYATRKWLYLQGDKLDLERNKQMVLGSTP